MAFLHYVVLAVLGVLALASIATAATEQEALIYLENLEGRISNEHNLEKVAAWNYVTNITEETAAISAEATRHFVQYQASVQSEILELFPNWKTFSAPVRRQFQHLSILGPAHMSQADQDLMAAIKSELDTAYASTTICEYNNPDKCDIGLGALDGLFNTIEDYDELEYYWTSWHDAMSANVNGSSYRDYMFYQNLMARHNGFSDMSEMWLAEFNPTDVPNWSAKEFKFEMIKVWEGLQPYYNLLHAYLRMKLRQNPLYTDKIDKLGSIPANLMQGYGLSKSDFTHFYHATKPYPEALSILESGTAALIDGNYTVDKIFEVSDDFFASLGLPRMTSSFWDNSMFQDPQDGRVVDCNPPFEWDMGLGRDSEDFRIKLCGEVNMDYMTIIHHEMGHMEYFMAYTDHNYILRDGANPGFHEAVGNTFHLPIATAKHFVCTLDLDIGYEVDCSNGQDGTLRPEDINYLYQLALDKFGFYSYTIALEEWRWNVFEETLPLDQYNERWWELKRKYQGVKVPAPRPEHGFDAATRIITTPNYIRYYNSYVLQFQIFKSLCQIAGQGDSPEALHKCDFTGNQAVGTALSHLLSFGFSQPWPSVLEGLTGSDHMQIQPVIEFFQPLFDYLSQELENAGEKPCFDEWCPVEAHLEKSVPAESNMLYSDELGNERIEEIDY